MQVESAQTGSVLGRIVAARRESLARARQVTLAAQLEARIVSAPPVRDFRAALTGEGFNVIAECKKASPSEGLLCARYNPAALAPSYEAAGACALSVLTEPDFFQGSLEDLTVARQVTDLPVLRKDFIFDTYQLLEARAAGADAFLLIVAVLSPDELRSLMAKGQELGMAALVEVHTAGEIEQAVEAGAGLIGVNNRDLKTMEVDIETSLRLIERIPDACVAVSESGLYTKGNLERLRGAGFSAFLIGTHFMRSDDPGAALRDLLGEVREVREIRDEERL